MAPTVRGTLAALGIAALAFSMTACGDDDASNDTVEQQSDGQNTESGSGSDTGGGSDSGSSGGDISDALEDVTGMENLEECVAVAATYGGFAVSALGGEDAAKDVASQLEEMKQNLPDELDDALDTVADAYQKVADEGLIDGAGALDTEEFKAADQEIKDYLNENCGTGSGG